MAYIGKGPAYGAYQKQNLTVNGSTTIFDLNYKIASDTSIMVVSGGVVQEPGVSYNTLSGGAQIQFTEAPVESTYIVYLGKQFLVPYQAGYETQVENFVGDGSKTVFTLTNNPVVGSGVLTFVNGIQQTLGAGKNFTFAGQSLTFSSAPGVGAEIDVYVLARERVSIDTVSDNVLTRAKLATNIKNSVAVWSTVSTNTNVVDGTWYFVDTLAGAITMTLPSAATAGDTFKFIDLSGTFGVNYCTLARNGQKINGLSEDLIMNIRNASVTLIYTGSTFGWRVIA